MKENSPFKIDFVGIGAAKCGTGWVAQCLREHPEVSFPEQKEIQFFNKTKSIYTEDTVWNYEKGLSWYAKHFERGGNNLIGEITTDYIYDKETPALIKKHFPEVKVIVCLRDPVDRTYSHYWWYKANFKKEKAETFEKALETQPEYIKRSLYYPQLKRYYDTFTRENIHVILLAEIKGKPKETAKSLFKFLEIDSEFVPGSVAEKQNAARQVRFPLLARIIPLMEILRSKGIELRILKKLGIYRLFQDLYASFNTSKYKYPEMERKTKIRLKNYFQEDIEKLETLTGLDLGKWK